MRLAHPASGTVAVFASSFDLFHLSKSSPELTSSPASHWTWQRAKADRRVLYEEPHRAGLSDRLRYDHLRAHEECLLAIPDAPA
ncbi:hypothetical protein GCM10011608_16360 [Micromonospora sonchi]|uniref:Uncharacterized protein n=1 Tax=Micromonospora sonchi TaxID=1763543 RepID=A0A917WVG4_9ACTN|nr:hypothetical protein GCM10011608_16360 [Micromonospora sonchi]